MTFQKELMGRSTPEFPCLLYEENIRRRIIRDRRKRKGRGGSGRREIFQGSCQKVHLKMSLRH
jgi:hypothetical protein